MDDVKAFGSSFNADWASKKSEADFVKEFAHTDHLFPEAPDDGKDQATRLKEVYGVIMKNKLAEEAAKKQASVPAQPAAPVPQKP